MLITHFPFLYLTLHNSNGRMVLTTPEVGSILPAEDEEHLFSPDGVDPLDLETSNKAVLESTLTKRFCNFTIDEEEYVVKLFSSYFESKEDFESADNIISALLQTSQGCAVLSKYGSFNIRMELIAIKFHRLGIISRVS